MTNITLKKSQEEKIRDELDRKIVRMLPNGAQIEMQLIETDNKQAKAEITVRHIGFYVKGTGISETSHPETAVLDAITDLKRRLRKAKTKRVLSRQRSKGLAELVESLIAETDVAEDDKPAILRKKEFELQMMDAEEAVEQMNLLGHSFFLFLGEDGAPCVVYQRHNGYGLLIGN